jgi:hypothetical protein
VNGFEQEETGQESKSGELALKLSAARPSTRLTLLGEQRETGQESKSGELALKLSVPRPSTRLTLLGGGSDTGSLSGGDLENNTFSS